MALRTLQGLLLAAAIGWAIFPYWGGLAFGAVYGLLLLTIVSKKRAAKKKLASNAEAMAAALTPEAIDWAKTHPLFYVWPTAAKAWALTMKMTSLMMILLGMVFVARGIFLFFLQPWVWLCLIPAAIVFFVGVTWGDKLDLDAWLAEEKWKAKKPLHDEVKKVLTLQSLAGKWAPGEPA